MFMRRSNTCKQFLIQRLLPDIWSLFDLLDRHRSLAQDRTREGSHL